MKKKMYKTKQGLSKEDLLNSPATRQQKKILANCPVVQVHRMMKNLSQCPVCFVDSSVLLSDLHLLILCNNYIMSSRFLSCVEIESKLANCFSINLLVVSKLYLNSLHRHFENVRKRPQH